MTPRSSWKCRKRGGTKGKDETTEVDIIQEESKTAEKTKDGLNHGNICMHRAGGGGEKAEKR